MTIIQPVSRYGSTVVKSVSPGVPSGSSFVPTVESYADWRSDTGDLSYTAQLPSGVTAGDHLTIIIVSTVGNSTVGTPSGFTLVRQTTTTGGGGTYDDCIVSVFEKIATGSEGSSVTGTLGGFSEVAGMSIRVSGGTGVAVDSAIANTAMVTGVNTLATPSVSADAGSILLLYFAAVGPGGTLTVSFASGSLIGQSDQADPGRVGAAYLDLPSSTMTGTINATFTASPSYWNSIGVAGQVVIAGSGGGAQDESGGSTALIDVTALGAGFAIESGSGGSSALVDSIVSGSGIGEEFTSGGSYSLVSVVSSGAGSASESESSGSDATVSISTSGADGYPWRSTSGWLCLGSRW